MEQRVSSQSPSDQPPIDTSRYLWKLSLKAEKYFAEHPGAAEILELESKDKDKDKDLTADVLFRHLDDKPHLQQKLADLLDYNPSRWLLSQEIPVVRERRKIHKIPGSNYDPAVEDPYEWAQKNHLQGICFSGGGIRSATFNLGVLQGLAKLEMLNRFDYLSSVSGGGYIHEWLAAWIKREEISQKEQSGSKYVPGSGLKEVEKQLIPLPHTKRYPAHPQPIRWLRRYSNYLTPQKGLFTGDTWVAIAIWLRNTFLNQLILISGLFFLLLIPYLTGRSILHLHPYLSTVVSVLLFLLAVIIVAIELQNEYSRVRYQDRRDEQLAKEPVPQESAGPVHPEPQKHEAPRRWGGEKTIQAGVVLPLLLASVLHLNVVISSPNPVGAWYCNREYILVFVLLWLLIAAAATSGLEEFKTLNKPDDAKPAASPASNTARVVQPDRRNRTWELIVIRVKGIGGLVLLNAVLSALAGTLLFVGVRSALHWTRPSWIPTPFLGGPDAWRFQFAFGPPLLLAVPFFTIVIGAGLIGRDFPDWLREWLARVRAWALLCGFGWGLFFGIALLGPYLVHWLTKPAKLSAAIVWLGTTAGAVLAGKSNKTSGKPAEGPVRSLPLDLLAKAGAYVFILGLLLALSFAVERSFDYVAGTHSTLLRSLLIVLPLGIFFLFGWRVDVNDFSLNPFYRNRLTRCYLGASNRYRAPNPLTGFDDRDTRGMRISCLTPSQGYTGPFPIVCAAINLSFGEDLAWQERKAASFAFAPIHSGYNVGWTAGKPGVHLNSCGFVPTSTYAFPAGGINIATAVAISGAAASPNWGYHTDPATAFLMTMFNVRLGWWLFNPRRPETKSLPSPRFAPLELTKELLGMVNDTSKFVYLSDGGHFDNMGLYELVRRRCYRIVICDAEQDENYRFEGIANAIRKCRIDFGVEITLDLSDLRLVELTGNCKSHWAEGKIRYPETPAEPQHEGEILYIKSSLTGAGKYCVGEGKSNIDLPTEPIDIINYKFTHQHFPHDTTANQWFTESQFESYRRLGYHVIDEVDRCDKWTNFRQSPPSESLSIGLSGGGTG